MLKGTPPADLRSSSHQVRDVINLKTAASPDLDIPPRVLAIADEVIG